MESEALLSFAPRLESVLMYVLRRLSWPTHITWPMWYATMTTVNKEKWREKMSYFKEGKWEAKMSKIRKWGREKKKNIKNAILAHPTHRCYLCCFCCFNCFLFSFQVAQKLCLLHVNPCHKLLYLFLFSSSHTAVWIMYISHALNPQNT